MWCLSRVRVPSLPLIDSAWAARTVSGGSGGEAARLDSWHGGVLALRHRESRRGALLLGVRRVPRRRRIRGAEDGDDRLQRPVRIHSARRAARRGVGAAFARPLLRGGAGHARASRRDSREIRRRRGNGRLRDSTGARRRRPGARARRTPCHSNGGEHGRDRGRSRRDAGHGRCRQRGRSARASRDTGEILIGARTHALVAAAVEAQPVAPVAAKGKAMPVDAYRLLNVRRGTEAVVRRFDLPMIGRQAELEGLRRAFLKARVERCCELITVVGEAGRGKSRLAEELVRRLGGQATVLQGRCLPYGEGITYWPLVEILRRATQEFDARVIELLQDEPDAELIASHLETAIAGDSPRSSDELAWATRKLLERIARERPLLVVVDDIQWAAQTFVDLLEHVALLTRDAPLLLLCLARTELVTLRPGWPGERVEL